MRKGNAFSRVYLPVYPSVCVYLFSLELLNHLNQSSKNFILSLQIHLYNIYLRF